SIRPWFGPEQTSGVSVGLAAGRDRPDDLDLAVAHADVPVVHVGGGIAVAWHQTQLLADLEHALGIFDDAVLVRALDVFHVAAPVDDRQAAVDRLRLQAGIDDRLVGLGVAHHLGQDEERVLPLALVDALAVLVEDAAVIRVHEGIGAALKLVEYARSRLEVIAAGAAARHELGLQPDRLQRLHRVLDHADGDIQLGLAVLILVHVLHRALIGLDAPELQAGGGLDRARDRHHVLRRGDTAASGAAIDLDEDAQLGPVLLCGGRKLGNVRQVIDADDD